MRIIAATKNKGKIKELQSILGEIGAEVVSQGDVDIDVEVEETGTTFEQNALIKARAVAMMCDDIVLADDSGLCVDCLDGRPGIYSARYAGENATDREKIDKLLAEIGDTKNRKAKFVTVVAVVFPNGHGITVTGEVSGTITYEPRGENGFGYDSVFLCDELKKTFGEATDEEKNAVSHRARALRNLYQKLSEFMN